ncbi:MAG: outer membrane beta-barrel protein [Devosia sp.]|nr:outer membrane beta-barrel protein [Devosia sp.]
MIAHRFRTATALGTGLVGLLPVAAVAQGAGAYDWSGFYLGGTIGVIQRGGSDNISYPDTTASSGSYTFSGGNLYLGTTTEDTGLPAAFTLDQLGGVVGLNAGYNFTSGNLVYGVEGDFSLLNGAHELASGQSSGGKTTVTVDNSLTSLMTLRGRVGISADRLLLFATAGLAAGQTSLSTDLNYQDFGKSSAALSGSGSGLPVGFVAGIGGEYAATDHISLKAEALYYRLGGTSATATGSGTDSSNNSVGASPYTATYNPSGVLVSSGIDFKF